MSFYEAQFIPIKESWSVEQAEQWLNDFANGSIGDMVDSDDDDDDDDDDGKLQSDMFGPYYDDDCRW